METEVTRSAKPTAIALSLPAANLARMAVLAANLGLWTLIVMVVRAL